MLHPQTESEAYAIEQNERFFQAVRSVPSYIRWLYGARMNMRSEDLLEVNELLPDLDVVFHSRMAEVERKPRPGIIRPIVESITRFVRQAPKGKRFRIASLGCGSMEAERQGIEAVNRNGTAQKMTVVGFDTSARTRQFAQKNLSSLADVRVVREERLTKSRLIELEQETSENVLVIISGNDIFTLASDFTPGTFDLVMTALFLHHLDKERRTRLVEHMSVLAPHTLNYDGYKNEMVIPLLSITGWGSPVFLNAAVFSSIRFMGREGVSRLHAGAKIDFYNHGHYRAVSSS